MLEKNNISNIDINTRCEYSECKSISYMGSFIINDFNIITTVSVSFLM